MVSRISYQRVKISSRLSIFNVIALFLGPPKVCEFVKLFFKSSKLESLPILARAASLRFLLTRLYDEIHNVKSDLVITKDPNEYFEKLKFHQSVKSVDEYGI